MKGIILVPIILGSTFLIAGGTLVGIALANNKADKIVENEYVIEDAFENFDIDLSIANLELIKSTDEKVKVVCKESEKELHEVKVGDNTLQIIQTNTKKWYERIFSWGWKERKVTVYLPETSYSEMMLHTSTGNVKIPSEFKFNKFTAKISTGNITVNADVETSTYVETSTGNINLGYMDTKNVSLKASTGNVVMYKVNAEEKIDIKTSTGNLNLTEIRAKNLETKCSTGNVLLTDVVMEEKIIMKTSTGNVKIVDSDMDTMNIDTDTGDVRGHLLSVHTFDCHTDTGKIRLPDNHSTGGLVTVNTDTGNIIFD